MEPQSDRARISPGTLVVFLAMVFVASIAAGVLIGDSGLLPGQTATGESSGPATDRLLVIGQVGSHIQDGSVGAVNLTVTVGRGTDPVDLQNATVTWVGPSGAHEVRHEGAPGARDGPTYLVTSIGDAGGSASVLEDADDRVTLTFDLGQTDDVAGIDEFGQRLRQGDVAKVLFRTGEDETTTTRLTVPASIEGRAAVAL